MVFKVGDSSQYAAPKKYGDDLRARLCRDYLTMRALGYWDLTGIITGLCVKYDLSRGAVHAILHQGGLK